MSLSQIFKTKIFIILCLIIMLVDFMYPVTFTVDGGHYLSYVDILNNKKSFSNWDPVRGVTFPLFLKVSLDVFGFNSNAFLIPMILMHLLLFLLSIYLILAETNIQNRLSRNLIIFLIFLIIGFDPLIIGYFHTLLTEYIATAIAIVSCFIAFKLYISLPITIKPSRTILFSTFYFLIAVPVAWHLKQPYVGAAWFPMLIVSLMIIIRNPGWRNILVTACANLIVILVLLLSNFVWNQSLPKTGEAANSNRKSDKFLSDIFQANRNLFLDSPIKFIREFGKSYLALSNVFIYDNENKKMIKDFSLFNANENRIIGYRLYNLIGQVNAFPMRSDLREGINNFVTNYNPPIYINSILLFQINKSNFLFSSLYLVLPAVFLFVFIVKIRKYRKTKPLIVPIICGGSALLNIIEHAFLTCQPFFLNLPLDRYVFWGYPLLLISAISMIIVLVIQLLMYQKDKSGNSPKFFIA